MTRKTSRVDNEYQGSILARHALPCCRTVGEADGCSGIATFWTDPDGAQLVQQYRSLPPRQRPDFAERPLLASRPQVTEKDMGSKRYRGKRCVYCGRDDASDTGDHVIARGFFLPSERGGLPQVPACNRCNNEKSRLEHHLTTVLPFGARQVARSANLCRDASDTMNGCTAISSTRGADSGTANMPNVG